MKKLTLTTLIFMLILSSCSKAQENDGATLPVTKKSFSIETQVIGKKKESYSVEKSARLTAGSALTLSTESV